MLTKEIGRPYRIDDKVVQDQRQRDDNDLQDERQDQPNKEEVEPRRSKRARIEKSFGPDFVSFMVENEPTSYQEALSIYPLANASNLGTRRKNNKSFRICPSLEGINRNKNLSAQEVSQWDGNGRKGKHVDVHRYSNSCDQPPDEEEVNLKSTYMPSTSMGEQQGNSDNKVEDIHNDTARLMTFSSNRADGGANDASLLDDEDYGIYDGYDNDAYVLTEEQLTSCDAFDITL
nr:hypothetical protein CTI12_AA390580 [Tanacetum cinerariifolium]